MRKYEAIDLMKLYTSSSSEKWNNFLNLCLANLSINDLAKTRYQIQAGMDDLAKTKLNTESINVQFVRWDKSLIDTAKKIIRIKNPMPHDVIIHGDEKDRPKDALEAKRRRDRELDHFMKESSY